VGAKVLDIVRPAKFLPVSARSAASRSDGQASCGKASRRPIRYLLHVATEVPTDLRLFMFASAAGIDTALKQDDTSGFGFGGIDLDI
jgi:hypothetical protein